MKKKLLTILFFALTYSAFLLYQGCDTTSRIQTNTNRTLAETDCPNPTIPFPSYQEKYGPPAWWCQENKADAKKFPIFQLSQNYPKNYEEIINSECPESECSWKNVNFRGNKDDQDKYLKNVIDYAFEGNLEVDWEIQKNLKRKWFHTPYMHLDIVDPLNKTIIKEKVAREFIHGLTMERDGCVSELLGKSMCDKTEEKFQSWAISFYNERGASYINKVWDEVTNPKSGVPDPQNFSEGFPDGAVAVKLLFTQATSDKVGYLEGSVEWDSDIGVSLKNPKEFLRLRERDPEGKISKEECEKNWKNCFPKLRLLQIDVAVKHKNDTDKAPTGWVFATFTYNKDAKPFVDYKFSSPEEEKNRAGWLRIEPLGLTFGNDPGVLKGGEIKESLLNTELRLPQHYGCGDDNDPFKRRLNGPVDNPASSCLSCHAQSETPKDLNIGDVEYRKMKCVDEGEHNIGYWFKNINPGNRNESTFTASTPKRKMFSLDYSLQLREGIRRYCVEKPGKCRLTYEKGDKFTVITKDGDKTYTIQ